MGTLEKFPINEYIDYIVLLVNPLNSIIMSANDFDAGFHEEIEDLVTEGLLDNTSDAYGIAQQVIHQGYDTLSYKQKFVYDNDVVPILEKRQEEIRVIQILNLNPE